MQKLGILKDAKIVCLFGALLFVASVAPKELTSNVEDLRNIRKYQIVSISHLSNESAVDDINFVITYQQQKHHQQTTNDDRYKEPRLIQIESKGFNDTSNTEPVLLFLTTFKDSCQKSAFLPQWKINNGTSNGVFRLQIYFNEKLKDSDLYYFCVRDEKLAVGPLLHLGTDSVFTIRSR